MFDLLRDIPASFSSADLYRRVAREWTTAFGHLVKLLLLVWLTQSAAAYVRVWSVAHDPKVLDTVAKLPHVVIERGEATVDLGQPYVLTGPDGKSAVAIFDTTGRTTGFDERSGQGFLFLRDRVLVRSAPGRDRAFPYPVDMRVEFDKDIAHGWVAWAGTWGAPLLSAAMLVFGTAMSFVYRTLLAVVLTVAGAPLGWWMGARIGWSARYRVAVVAMTPAIVLDTVMVFVARELEASSGAAVLFGVLNLGMLTFGLYANRATSAATSGEGAR